MSTLNVKRMPAALSLTVLGLLALPGVGAHAQDKTPPPPPDKNDSTGADPPAADTNDPTMQRVSLDLESTNLYSALKLLFDHINANYFLDPSLKNAEVSVHLHNVPFKIVLDTLVKSTGLPLTWKLEANIYRIVPKEVETTAQPEEGRLAPPETPESKTPRFVMLSRDSFAFDGLSIAEVLGGKPFSIFPRTFDYNPFPGTQSTTGTSAQNRGGGLGGGAGGSGGTGGAGGSGGSAFGGGGLGGSGAGSGRSGF